MQSNAGFIYTPSPEDAARKRLSDAAPELLQACKSTLEFFEREGWDLVAPIKELKRVIAKAEGGA